MERAIGEIFEFNGVKLQVEDEFKLSCERCFFDQFHCLHICDRATSNFTGECISSLRSDGKNVVFVEVKDNEK